MSNTSIALPYSKSLARPRYPSTPASSVRTGVAWQWVRHTLRRTRQPSSQRHTPRRHTNARTHAYPIRILYSLRTASINQPCTAEPVHQGLACSISILRGELPDGTASPRSVSIPSFRNSPPTLHDAPSTPALGDRVDRWGYRPKRGREGGRGGRDGGGEGRRGRGRGGERRGTKGTRGENTPSAEPCSCLCFFLTRLSRAEGIGCATDFRFDSPLGGGGLAISHAAAARPGAGPGAAAIKLRCDPPCSGVIYGDSALLRLDRLGRRWRRQKRQPNYIQQDAEGIERVASVAGRAFGTSLNSSK